MRDGEEEEREREEDTAKITKQSEFITLWEELE
jgi:hypothetical protein